MARKPRQSDLDFGSDSFLDIIANIVGILIIMIVIAGVRVSQNPVGGVPGTVPPTESAQAVESTPVEAEEEVEEQWVSESDAPLPIMPEAALVDLTPLAEPETPLQTELPARQNLEPAVPVVEPLPLITFDVELGTAESWRVATNPQFLRALNDNQQQLTESQKQQARHAQQAADLDQQQTELLRQQQNRQQQVSQLQRQQQEQQAQKSKLTAQYAALVKQQADLQEQLVLIQRSGTPAQTIQHAMVPLSKQVTAHEWHFEVRGGKVAFIPLDELLGQVKIKVERWAEWIAKYDTHESTVGPIDGFSMEYKVSRQRQSLSEELTGGNGTFRIGIDRWDLIPSENSTAETLAEAIQKNSYFRSTLNRCSIGDTITLWVYPDSFEMYQELSKIIHQMGYQVAGRPLPLGRRIGGSPQGSKSYGQ